MADWFRKSTWTDADRDDFESRLARTRRASRAQYLRIQASHLAVAGNHKAALDLLHRMLNDYPDPVQNNMALAQKAECLDAVGLTEQALEAFRAAIVAERTFPNVRSRVVFEFPLFVARRGLRNVFAEAISILDGTRDDQTFPRDRFDAACARCLIAAEVGDAATAKAQAEVALAAAAEGHSGFSRHPDIGLVPVHNPLLPQLRRIAG